jgi:autotransporter-associated beta strand protein
LLLSAVNTYDGPPTVSDGTLLVNGQIDTNVVTVSGGALGGSGTILGPVTVQSAGTLVPGTASIGSLTIDNDLTIAGNALFKINKSVSPSNDTAVVSGALSNTGTGTLTVTNVGPAVSVGDSFKLFSEPVANGSALIVTGGGILWTNRLALDGTIAVLATSILPSTPTNISFSVSSGNISITWPGSYLGWQLEAQTNTLRSGLNTNNSAWSIIPGSTTTTNESFIISPANPSVFYRLAHP